MLGRPLRWNIARWRSLTLPYRTAFYWTCWTRRTLAAFGGTGGWAGDKAYADDADAVGDATVTIGPVSATGWRGAEGRFSAGIPFQGAAMLSLITERVSQSS